MAPSGSESSILRGSTMEFFFDLIVILSVIQVTLAVLFLFVQVTLAVLFSLALVVLFGFSKEKPEELPPIEFDWKQEGF